MIVISDTSPLNYLIMIGLDHLLPKLFGEVVAPLAVINELQNVAAPTHVQSWARNPPGWLNIQSPTNSI